MHRVMHHVPCTVFATQTKIPKPTIIMVTLMNVLYEFVEQMLRWHADSTEESVLQLALAYWLGMSNALHFILGNWFGRIELRNRFWRLLHRRMAHTDVAGTTTRYQQRYLQDGRMHDDDDIAVAAAADYFDDDDTSRHANGRLVRLNWPTQPQWFAIAKCVFVCEPRSEIGILSREDIAYLECCMQQRIRGWEHDIRWMVTRNRE